MKKHLRHFCLLLVGVLLTFSAQQVRASHAIGADMNYINVGPGLYYVQYRFYRDCSGAVGAPVAADLQYQATGCGAAGTGTVANANQNLALRDYDVGNPYCSRINVTSPCDSAGGRVTSDFPNYQVYTYAGIVNLGTGVDRQCTQWSLSVSVNARPPSINLVEPDLANLFSLVTFNNSVVPDDSSPAFSNQLGFKPLIFTCDSSTQRIASPVIDPDNALNPGTDSLVYTLQQPLSAANTVVPWAAGFSTLSPVRVLTGVAQTPAGEPVIPFSVNPNNGEISFTSGAFSTNTTNFNENNKYAFTVQVDSYRKLNGQRVKISSVRRDLLVAIFNCNPRPTAPVVDQTDTAVSNVGLDTTRITSRNDTIVVDACVNSRVSFIIEDFNGDSIYATIPDNQLPGEASIQITPVNYIPGIRRQVRVTLTWVPDAATIGGYYPVTLSIGDNGCPIPGITTQTLVLHVIRNQYSDVGLFTSNNNGVNDTLCVGQVTQLVATTRRPATLGFPPLPAVYQYNWLVDADSTILRTNADTAIVRPLRTTRYFLEVVSPQGCVDTASILVRVDPTNRASAEPDTICRGGSALLDVQGRARRVGPNNVPITYTYRWVDSAAIASGQPTTLSDSTSQTPTARPLVTTRYYATVYSSLGCTDTSSVLVTVNAANVATAVVQTDSVCPGQLAQLSVSRRPENLTPDGVPIVYTYQWVDSAAIASGQPSTLIVSTSQNPTARPLVTTRYYATVFSSFGCTDTASVLVTVDAANVATAVVQTDSVCPGQLAQLSVSRRPENATPDGVPIVYTYQWVDSAAIVSGQPSTLVDFTIQNPTARPLRTTRYYATVFSSFGCTDTASAVVHTVGPSPIIDTIAIATQTLSGRGLTYGQNGVPSLAATNDDGRFTYRIRGAENLQVFSDTTSATPTVAGLTHTTTYTLVASNAFGCEARAAFTIVVPLNVPNVITPNGDKLNDEFVIEGVQAPELSIYNRWGREIKKWGSYDNKWNGDDLPAGTYYYHLRDKEQNKTYKGWLEIVR